MAVLALLIMAISIWVACLHIKLADFRYDVYLLKRRASDRHCRPRADDVVLDTEEEELDVAAYNPFSRICPDHSEVCNRLLHLEAVTPMAEYRRRVQREELEAEAED